MFSGVTAATGLHPVTGGGGGSAPDPWAGRCGPYGLGYRIGNRCILVFATGGSAARLLRSNDGGGSWSSASVPIASSASAGVFAIAFRSVEIGYAIGGDYAAPASPGSFAITSDAGVTWRAGAAPRGYRSSIAIAADALIVVGTSGSDVSYDEGVTWNAIDDTPLNSVRVIGDVAFAVGPDGRFARLALAR